MALVKKIFLTKRVHYVTFRGATSHTNPVLSRVPQGSIVEPLLFIIYITYSSCFLFADDAKVYKPINSSQHHTEIDVDLEAISSWCIKWHLNINFSKCSAIRFSSCISQGHTCRCMNYKIDRHPSS